MTKNINQDYHPMWEKPKHHTRSTVKNSHVHWIELFYDLVHVVCIFLLGNLLSQNLTIEGFLKMVKPVNLVRTEIENYK